MATIKKRSNKHFTAEIHIDGQYKSKTFDTKIQAMAWATETEQALSPDGLVKGKTLGHVFERYHDEISPAKKSHRNEPNRLNKFLRSSLRGLSLNT